MIFILISLVIFKDPIVADWYKQFISRIVWFLPTFSKFIFGQRRFLNYYKRAMRFTRINMNQCIKINFFIRWNRGLLSVWWLGIINFVGNIWRDWRLFWRVACTRICCLCLFRVFYIFFIFFLLTNLETAKISCAISHI